MHKDVLRIDGRGRCWGSAYSCGCRGTWRPVLLIKLDTFFACNVIFIIRLVSKVNKNIVCQFENQNYNFKKLYVHRYIKVKLLTTSLLKTHVKLIKPKSSLVFSYILSIHSYKLKKRKKYIWKKSSKKVNTGVVLKIKPWFYLQSCPSCFAVFLFNSASWKGAICKQYLFPAVPK